MPSAFGAGGGNWQRPAAPISVATNLVDPATGSVQPSGLSGWTLTLSEEFGGSMSTVSAPLGHVKFRADGPTWGTWYPGTASEPDPHTNNPGTEYEYYDPSAIALVSGALEFTATKDSVHAGLPYTSGMIQSNPSLNQTYGFFEARMKCPGTSESWPAFWIIPATYEWPPEVDIMENFGSTTTFTTSNFGPGHTVFGNDHTTTATSYQTYGLKWTSTQLVWYLNGTVIDTENVSGSVPQQDMYVVLNLAVRGTTITQHKAQVEYVRVWQ